MKWYSGRYDRAFKEVMLKEANQDILKSLLEKILNLQISSMCILNNERLRDNVHIKGQRLDLILDTNIGKINVEVNSSYKDYVRYRNTAYLCDIYAHDILVGHNYDGNMKYIQINLSYDLGYNSGSINIYKIKNEEDKTYIDNFIIYDVNMDYYMNLWYTKSEEIKDNVMLVMIGLEKEELTKLSKKDRMVSRYMSELNKVNEEPEFREYMSYEEDQRKIRNSLIAESRAEGKAEGLEEGHEKGLEEGMSIGETKGKNERNKEIAKKLLEKGMTIDFIMDTTNMTEEEILKLKEEN